MISMRISILFIFSCTFLQSGIILNNIQSVVFEDGGFIFCPTFNEMGDVVAVEKWKGSDGLQTWLIDVKEIDNRIINIENYTKRIQTIGK